MFCFYKVVPGTRYLCVSWFDGHRAACIYLSEETPRTLGALDVGMMSRKNGRTHELFHRHVCIDVSYTSTWNIPDRLRRGIVYRQVSYTYLVWYTRILKIIPGVESSWNQWNNFMVLFVEVAVPVETGNLRSTGRPVVRQYSSSSPLCVQWHVPGIGGLCS